MSSKTVVLFGIMMVMLLTFCSTEDTVLIEPTADTTIVPTPVEPSVAGVAVTSTPLPATLTPSPTRSHEMILPLPTSTPTPMDLPVLPEIQDDNLLFIEAYGQGYSKFDYALSQQPSEEQAFPIVVLDHVVSSDPNDSEMGPASARLFSFAHFADRLAYWTADENGAQLWISDLEITVSESIYVDGSRSYSEAQNDDVSFELAWTPDDLHLIWSAASDSPDYIYHLQSNLIELWPWSCDRIALSPITNHLATWCSSQDSETLFAVIEWGGDIWQSEAPPESEIVRQGDGSQYSRPIWAWSSNGEKLAYFDSSGALVIVDAQGNELLSFADAAWWMTEAVLESRIYLPRTLLQWAEDGSGLVVFAFPLSDYDCPSYQDYWSESNDSFIVPCLQLLELETETILWTWADLVKLTEELFSHSWQIWDFAVSSHGKRIALNIAIAGNVELGIVDIVNNQYEQWSAYGGSRIRWSND